MPETSQIYVGTAGWSYKDWEGIVYPAQIKKSEHPVEYMARFVDVLEINTSFYGHIKPEWGKLWCRRARAVNPQFLFTAKLNRAFTHSPIAVLESTSAETIRATQEDEQLAKEGLDCTVAVVAPERRASLRVQAMAPGMLWEIARQSRILPVRIWKL